MYFKTISNVIFYPETSRTAMASNQQIGGHFKTFYEFKLKINFLYRKSSTMFRKIIPPTHHRHVLVIFIMTNVLLMPHKQQQLKQSRNPNILQ